MFEPAEGVVSPEGSESPDSVILEQETPKKEETQTSPESDKALPVEAVTAGTSEPDSLGELPKAEKPVEVESTRIEQTSEDVREVETAQKSTQERAQLLEEETSAVVLTPKHIETPDGPSPLTSTALAVTRKRQVARLSLAKPSNTGVEKEAA